MSNSNLQGALIALFGFAIFATHDAIVKTLGAVYSPVQIVFFSVILGFPLLTVLLISDGTPGTLRPRHPWWMLLRSTAVVITGVTAFYAFSKIPLAQVYAILFATPLLITVLSIPILGETVRVRRWMAVIVGLCGVLIVLRPGSADLGLGHLAALIAAVSSATSAITVRRLGGEERSAVLALFPMLASAIVMGCLLPFVYRPMPLGDLGLLGVVAAFGFVGMLCSIAAYRRAEAVIVAPMQYSQILWATIYGLLFFDERPDGMTALGAAVVIGSGVYILLREARPETSRTTPVLSTRTRLETGTAPRVSSVMDADENGA